MATDKLRVGLIGCGGIAPAHLSSYRRNERVDVVAVADLDMERAESLAKEAGATAYSSYVEMLEKERLDAVSLLTPPDSHRTIAEVALSAGVHIFSEKPLAKTSADGKAMAEAASSAGKLLMVAQCHRFHEPVRRAKELISQGRLGEMVTYRNRFGYIAGKPNATTRGRGGILLDNGSHSSYIFRYLVGPVKSALGWAPSDQLAQVEDLCVCTVILQASNGVGGVIELDGAARPCPSVMEVYGTEGAIVIDYAGGSQFLPANGDPPLSLDNPELPGAHRFDREIDHFVACVMGEEDPEVGVEEGIADLLVLEACYESMTSGKRVSL
ncbi:MAG: Gfo/Idh/MocA family oxidoreductase [Armatimonadetes bacterium]|nr:Gfo/Idh/MocA family oxidoreductase [Armatimonadota bacterium]